MDAADQGAERLAQVLQALRHGELASAIARAVVESERVEDKAKAWDDCVRRIRTEGRRRKLLAKQVEIHAAESVGDEAQTAALIGEYNQLVKEPSPSWR
jgi:hypothetical protein